METLPEYIGTETQQFDISPEHIIFEREQKTIFNDGALQRLISAESFDRAMMWLSSLDSDEYHHKIAGIVEIFRNYDEIPASDSKMLEESAKANALELTAYSIPHSKIQDIIGATSLPLDDIGYGFPPSTKDALMVIEAWDITRDDSVFEAALRMVENASMGDGVRMDFTERLLRAHDNGILFRDTIVTPLSNKPGQSISRAAPQNVLDDEPIAEKPEIDWVSQPRKVLAS